MSHFNDFDHRQVVWGLFGVFLVAVLAMVVLPFLGTFVAAVFLYYAVRPAYTRINDRLSRPNVAATVTLLLVALPIFVVVGYALMISIQNVDQLLQSADLGTYRSMLKPYLGVADSFSNPQQLLSKLQGSAGGSPQTLLSGVLAALGTFFSVLLRLFLVFAFAFYLLRDDHKLSGWTRDHFAAADTAETQVFEQYVDQVDDALQTVYFGNLLNVVVISLLATVTNLGLNVVAPAGSAIPYPILVGVLTGIGSLVPAVGMKIVYVPLTAILVASTAITGGAIWVPIVYLVVSFTVVDTIPDFVVRAYLSGRSLHMGLVMFSYILGSAVFGWYGIFLGPFLLVVIYHFGDVVVSSISPRQAG